MQTILTVTLNPAIDVSTTVERIEPGAKLRCGPGRRDAGGGGINVARVVTRLGGDALAIFPAGGLTGELLTRLLAAEGVPVAATPIAGDTREDFTIVERSTGREYRFVLEGPRLAWTEWQACLDAAVQPGDAAGVVVASGSLPPGAPTDFHVRLATAAKAAGDRVILDVSGPTLAAALEEGVYLIKPNLRELGELTGEGVDDPLAAMRAARAIVARGGAEVVALTLGAQGAVLVTAEATWRSPALPVIPVSTVGAGDSFLGGLVQALATGANLQDAFRLGMACGAAALLSPGTGLCEPAEVARLLPLVQIDPL